MSTDILDMISRGRYLVPNHMWPSVERYFVNKIPPGAFLYALLCNAPIMKVIGSADDINLEGIADWCKFLYSYVPGMAWGSEEKVQAWLGENLWVDIP